MMKRSRMVLVVDDDLEYVSLLSRALGATYAVTVAADGEEAIMKARIAKPDVIVLDVMMPGGKDGFSTFCELRKDPATRNIPVIMCSEVGRKTGLPFGGESMEQFLGAAPAAFLEKPISAERLLDELRKVLDDERLSKKAPRKSKGDTSD